MKNYKRIANTGLLIVVILTQHVLVTERPACAASRTVSLITDKSTGPAVRHGMNKVIAALQEKGIAVDEISDMAQPVVIFSLRQVCRMAAVKRKCCLHRSIFLCRNIRNPC